MVVRPLRCLPWILPDTGCLGPSAQFPGQVTLLTHFYEDFSYISTMLQCEANQSDIFLWCHRLARVVSCCPGRKQTKIGQRQQYGKTYLPSKQSNGYLPGKRITEKCIGA